MASGVLIDVAELLARLNEVALLDTRFELNDPDWGAAQYGAGHVPGAQYADLDRDLSDLTRKGRYGRHPLPDSARFAQCCARWGLEPGRTIVVYDQGPGPYAARAWWMLRAQGYTDVRVLDGGWAAWQAAGAAIERGTPRPRACARPLDAAYQALPWIDTETLQRRLRHAAVRLVDARAAPRFRGEVEPIDPVAGHVPGAINRPFQDNLDAAGRFKPVAVLREEWMALLAGDAPSRVVHMCGSGVTACHNLLAMEHCGLGGSALYPPSWSGWILDPERPVARGD